MKIYRQGDVSLVSVEKLPETAVEILPNEQDKIILALSEATGHHHRIEDVLSKEQTKVRLWTAAGERFLQVLVSCELRHEEHSAANLDPGIYKLPTQVEYNPKELLRVTD